MSYVVLDIETTGLDVMRGAIVEIGAIKVLPNGQTETFATLVKPRVPIEPDAFKTHGITEDEARDRGLEPSEAFKELLEFIGSSPIVAHNGFRFDFPYLMNEINRAGLAVPQNRLLDTMKLVDRILNFKGPLRLGSLCDAFGINNENAHRALSDARATGRLMQIVTAQEANIDTLWEETLRLIWPDLAKLSASYEILSQAISQGLDLEMHYQGKTKPASTRWIRPLYLLVGRDGPSSVIAQCYRQGVTKEFRLDRIKKLIQAGQTPPPRSTQGNVIPIDAPRRFFNPFTRVKGRS
jgi:DNA polymerase III epsilon subunit family exonuclease